MFSGDGGRDPGTGVGIRSHSGAAQAEKGYATKTSLGWFVSEQVEEEAEAQLLVDKLAMIGESKGSLLYLDKEAKKRE